MSIELLRENFRQRVKSEALADPRVKALARWALRKPDEQVAEAIELFTIGLDSSRQGRAAVLGVIDDEFRERSALLPHDERVAFLRWIVRSRVLDAKVRDKLRELREARSRTARSQIIASIIASEGDNPVSIDNAHPVFAYAWRAAPADARPSGEVHRGEPQPFIGAKNTVRLVIFFARCIGHLVPKAQKKAFDRLLKVATTAVAAERPSAALSAAIEGASKEGAIGIARSACAEARATLGRHDMAGVAARPAATRVVGILLEGEGKDAVRAFLSAADDELRRLDVAHAIHVRKLSPSREIRRAIHRGTERGKVVLWLAELDGGLFGLLSKQGRFWTWNEGHRDEILATIPDAHFERAVMGC